jgi:hypothetical protein
MRLNRLWIPITAVIAILLVVSHASQPALAITATPTAAMTCPSVTVQVQPVTSPTSATSQVINVTETGGGIPSYTIYARDSAGTLLNTVSGTGNNAAALTLPLQSNTIQYLTVTANAEVACTGPNGNAFVFVNGSTTVDVNGKTLVINQGNVFIPPTYTTTPTATNTATATVTPTATGTTISSPLKISGYVRLGSASGAGLPGVTILFALASYPVQPVATTDANGYYSYATDTQGHQETVTVQAQLAGYAFTPSSYYYSSPSFGSTTTIDFVATSVITPTSTPISGSDLTITGTVTDAVTHAPISGATIVVTSCHPRAFSTNTAANGTYSLFIPGSYNCGNLPMSFSASGYTSYNISNALNLITANGPVINAALQPIAKVCAVTYTVTSDWSNGATHGFVANVTIKNTGTQSVSAWALTWNFPGNQQITQIWNGTVSQSGASVRVTNASWNGSIAPGSTVNFGFSGSYTGTNVNPTAFQLNGGACQ